MAQNGPAEGLFDATGQPLDRMPDLILPAANAAVFNERGEVLLQRRADNGYWGLPGGKVDIGESVENCAVREVFEETGLRVRAGRLVGIYSNPREYCVMSYPDGNIVQFVTVLFECERVSGALRISEESTDIGYFPVDALPEHTMTAHHVRIQDAAARCTTPFVR